ncbi:MAG: hypothetical protein HN494_07225 [Opitutae bacterium]|nr:hypothetical protein [Opitutae bacterium]
MMLIYHKGYSLSLIKVLPNPIRHSSGNPACKRVETTRPATRRDSLDHARAPSRHPRFDLIQQGGDGGRREFIHA